MAMIAGPFAGLVPGHVDEHLLQHGQQVVLPFLVHEVVGDERDGLPLPPEVQSAAGDQDVQMGVVVAAASSRLQDDDGADVQLGAGRGAKDVLQASLAGPHQATEKGRISIKPGVEEVGHG